MTRSIIIAMALAASGSGAVLAQGRPAAPATIDLSKLRPASDAERQKVGGDKFKLLTLKPVPWLIAQMAPANDMKGWTQLTNGASKGGPSVVRLSATEARIVVRGADNGLYMATINPVNPGGPIDSAAWKSLGVTANSEPNCARSSAAYGSSKAEIACAWLGAAGNAVFAVINDNLIERDMGGSKADGRPALVAGSEGFDESWGPGYYIVQAKLVVLGNDMLFRRNYVSSQMKRADGTILDPKIQDTGWIKEPGFSAPTQCESGVCTFRRGDVIGHGDPFDSLPGGKALPMPGGFSKTALAFAKLASGQGAIVGTNAAGRVYRSVGSGFTFTPWADEGGTIKAGSSLSCIANGEQPLCFAQGFDGRIYWKKFGTASGL